MPSNCAYCSESLSRNTGNSIINCNKCKKVFHLKCAGVTVNELSIVKNNWCCTECRINEIGEAVKRIDVSVAKFKESTNDAITSIAENVNKVVGLGKAVSENSKRIEALGLQNVHLKAEIKELKSAVDRTESLAKQNNLIISGIPENKDENLINILVNLLNTLDIQLPHNTISTARRIRTRNGSVRPVLLVLANHDIKSKILSAYSKRNGIKCNSLGLDSENVIRIGNHLSSNVQNLLKETKATLQVTGKYKHVWITGDRILVRKDDDSKILNIKSADDIKRLGSE